jgi:hypothetical protein
MLQSQRNTRFRHLNSQYRFITHFTMKKASAYTLLLSACLITVAVAKWSRLPGSEKVPVNMSLSSAKAVVSDSHGITDSNNFVLGDPISPIRLASGKSDAVIKFVKQSVVNSASFASDGLEGKVDASISADGKAWSNLASAVFSPADRQVTLSTGTAQGRYLRLQFEIIRGGTIRGFKVFGSDTDADYTFEQNADNSGPMVNLASGIGGGRLIYISPETLANRNEAVKSGSIDFPESDEKYRTAVYDLGQVRTLGEFGSSHSAVPVRLSVYTFEVLPEKEDWRGRLTFDPTVFDSQEPAAMAEDPKGEGYVKIKTKTAVKTRYVALRWEPDFNPPAFVVGDVSVMAPGMASYSGGSGSGGQGQGQNNNNNNNNNPIPPGQIGGGAPSINGGFGGNSGGGSANPNQR